MNLRLVLQKQFANLKVFVLKSPHQWTPPELQYTRAIRNKQSYTIIITYVIIFPDIDITVFLLQVASHHFNVSCLTATFCQ